MKQHSYWKCGRMCRPNTAHVQNALHCNHDGRAGLFRGCISPWPCPCPALCTSSRADTAHLRAAPPCHASDESWRAQHCVWCSQAPTGRAAWACWRSRWDGSRTTHVAHASAIPAFPPRSAIPARGRRAYGCRIAGRFGPERPGVTAAALVQPCRRAAQPVRQRHALALPAGPAPHPLCQRLLQRG